MVGFCGLGSFCRLGGFLVVWSEWFGLRCDVGSCYSLLYQKLQCLRRCSATSLQCFSALAAFGIFKGFERFWAVENL